MLQGLVTSARVLSRLFTAHPDATLEAQWGVKWALKTERNAIAAPTETPALSWYSMIMLFIIFSWPTLLFITFQARAHIVRGIKHVAATLREPLATAIHNYGAVRLFIYMLVLCNSEENTLLFQVHASRHIDSSILSSCVLLEVIRIVIRALKTAFCGAVTNDPSTAPLVGSDLVSCPGTGNPVRPLTLRGGQFGFDIARDENRALVKVRRRSFPARRAGTAPAASAAGL